MRPNPPRDRKLEFSSEVDRLVGTPINQASIDAADCKRLGIYLARMRTEGGASTTANILVQRDPPLLMQVCHQQHIHGRHPIYVPQSEGTSLPQSFTAAFCPPPLRESAEESLGHSGSFTGRTSLSVTSENRTCCTFWTRIVSCLPTPTESFGGEDRYYGCLDLEAVWV